MTTLYSKDKKGNLQLWEITTSNGSYTVRHGVIGGKIQSRTTLCYPKNVGKANATTASQQAEMEAEAKIALQLKRGYFLTKEEALGWKDTTPMKAHNYKDYAHRIKYPCFAQPKLNGLRCAVWRDGTAQSKSGEPLTLPAHIADDLKALFEEFPNLKGLDGEIYVHGKSLQKIVSAFRKYNELTPSLSYHVYDVPDETLTFVDRAQILEDIFGNEIDERGLSVIRVYTELVENMDTLDYFFEWFVSYGEEGIVIRNLDGMYEFGGRSFNMIKRKPIETAEALVLSALKDKNGDGVLNCSLENGVEFECLMRKDSSEAVNLRKYDNALSLIGQTIEFEYECLSDEGKPLKPVGIGVRPCDKHFQPLI